MRRCENCNLEILGRDPVCPLCGSLVGEDPSSPYRYPEYRTRNRVVRRIFIALTVAVIVIGLFINAFTYKKASYPWIAPLSAGAFILWLIMGSWMSRRMSWGAKIFNTYSGFWFVCLLVDISTGWNGWSTDLALPITVASEIITMFILVLCGKRNYTRFFSYFIISMLMSILPPVLHLFGLAETLWLSLSPLLLSFIAALTVYAISPKRMKREMEKRFRF